MLTRLLLFGCTVFTVDAVGCGTVWEGVPTFNNCMQRCHCKNDAACDEATGECSSGCGPGWAGPACQYRDATLGYVNVGHVGPSDSLASLAVDGDINTCSRVVPSVGAYGEWYLQLKNNTLINGVHLVIPGNELMNFDAFSIKLSADGIMYDMACYQHSMFPLNVSMDIPCSRTQVAKYVKINLATTGTPLVLCEVQVYSGRDISFNKHTTGAGTWTSAYKSSSAVDGQAFLSSSNFGTCYSTAGVEDQWWIVDFDNLYLVHGVITNMRNSCCFSQVTGFNISIRHGTSNDWTLIHNDTGSNYDRQETVLMQTYSTASVRLAKKLVPKNPFSICEVNVFGECPDGLCGWDCTDTCHCDVPPTGSHRIHGTCPTGCQSGYRGDIGTNRCDSTCSAYKWGDACQHNCGNCSSFPCYLGNGSCDGGCSGPWYPPACTSPCNDREYGINCSFNCGQCRDGKPCNKSTGVCPGQMCMDGWKFGLCQEKCDDGRYGYNCSLPCGHCFQNNTCSATDGVCPGGCAPGFNGSTCHEECPEGTYGLNCSGTCGNCKEGKPCNKESGICQNGCVPGYNDSMCKKQCPEGTYGDYCGGVCGTCHNDQVCHFKTGHCSGCGVGLQPPLCINACDQGFFGFNCSLICSEHCGDSGGCDVINGTCQNCSAGFKGDLCETQCDRGSYGHLCNSTCGYCIENTTCHHETGHCIAGCKSKYTGNRCKSLQQTATEPNDASPGPSPGVLGAIIGGLAVGVLIATISLVVFVIVRRRKASPVRKEGRTSMSELDDKVGDSVDDSHEYANAAYVNVDMCTAQSEIKQQNDNRISAKAVTKAQGEEENSNDHTYYHTFPEHKIPIKSVPSNTLREVAHKIRSDPSKIHKDFLALKAGLVHPCNEAMKPDNRPKNRYQRMYPYDTTRVKLPVENGEPTSDYINASYLDGYNIRRKYIAAQGAIASTVVDVWRMVWSQNVKVIVMLTKCVEMGKNKCFFYWSDSEALTFGDHTVEVTSLDTYADFVVRKLKFTKVSKNSYRIVTQYQFTSWPDKDIPDSPLSVLQFWKKIRQSEDANKTPWMVHCSAGIGRTGTFIALDYLYDQGIDKNQINVDDVVNNMREQRTNMIQTKDQYVYLYYVLCEALTPVGTVCKADQFSHCGEGSNQGKYVQTLNKEFSLICEETELLKAGYVNTDMDARHRSGNRPENKGKSRNPDTVPVDLFRPRLSMVVEEGNDFINAVYIPMFRAEKQLIMTQFPLPNTIIDFIRLVWELNIDTVILLEDSIDINGAYWPAQGIETSFGPIKAELLNQQTETTYTRRTIRFTFASKNVSKEVTQYHFTDWQSGKEIPPDTGCVLKIISDIQNKGTNIPIVVQCMDGAARSGLFAVIWCVLDRMKSDSEVAVAETVRAIRMIRPQTITGVEQYRFCHNIVQEYLDSFDIYMNAM